MLLVLRRITNREVIFKGGGRANSGYQPPRSAGDSAFEYDRNLNSLNRSVEKFVQARNIDRRIDCPTQLEDF